jgi:short-subunit dehydrogenase
MDLKGKKIMITGAAKGIGYLITQELRKKGAILVLVDKDQESLDQLKSEIGQDHSYYLCDLSSEVQVISLSVKLREDFESLDVLINNAGIGIYKTIEDLSFDDWVKSFFVNLHSPFLLSKELLPLLKAAERSLIVNIGSVSGVTPMASRLPYNPSKFALRGFSLCLAEDLQNTKVDVTLVTLGSTLTDFGPLSLSEKIILQKEGKKYLRPDTVSNRIVEIMENDERKTEEIILP